MAPRKVSDVYDPAIVPQLDAPTSEADDHCDASHHHSVCGLLDDQGDGDSEQHAGELEVATPNDELAVTVRSAHQRIVPGMGAACGVDGG